MRQEHKRWVVPERRETGYDLTKAFESQSESDWAQISRAHIYYILRHLAATGHDHESEPQGAHRRYLYPVTLAGESFMRQQLSQPDWLDDVSQSNVMTSLGLAAHLPYALVMTNLERRCDHLAKQIAKQIAIEDHVRNYSSPHPSFGVRLIKLYTG